jgi:hypothetical protein
VGGALLTPSVRAYLDGNSELLQPSTHFVAFLLLLFIIFLAEYLLFNILSSWVTIFRNACRMIALEAELNELCGSTALKWDGVISPEFYNLSSWVPRLMRFDLLGAAVIAFMLVLMSIVVSFIAYAVIREYVAAVFGFLGIVVSLNVYQFISLNGFLAEMKDRTSSLSETKQIQM